ncbi:acyl-CoA dehydrogenase family protein [Streptomyces sp. NPDC090088]|uniref:acyl-CoA dehydrogenase family protein n=1 Tax=Streptomyces sp. NPDC090088 TaxID=3365944 RepID=UPI0037FC72D1
MTTSTTFLRSPWNGRAGDAELEQWRQVAARVADQLAPGALRRDRGNELPVDELTLLRSSGLVNLLVPEAAGGAGAHWETAFHVIRTIARADASIGQILGYHYFNQACVTFYGDDEDRRLEWYRVSAANRWLWSDSFNPVDPDLTLTFDGSGHRLNGTKRFATGAQVADVIVAGAVPDSGPFAGRLVVFAVPNDRAGIEHLGDWDNLGYRASASSSVRYTDVAVETADVIGVDNDEPFSSMVTPGVQLLFGNIYLAITQAALAHARTLTLARPNAWFLSSVDRYANDPVLHRVIGELVARTAAVEALADALNRRFGDVVGRGGAVSAEDRAEIEVAVAALKVVATEVGLDATSRIFEATGASSTASRNGLDRYWRDIRTHSLHDPVEYKKIEVGAHYLTGAVQPVSLYT